MKKRNIVNIINFVRGCEPREHIDLVRPVAEQLKLSREYSMPATFLLQYDALENKEICEMLSSEAKDLRIELGVWLEIVEPMCDVCGIEWTGRFPWDWHVHCGFSVGYTPSQREKLVDALFAKFKDIYGFYPAVCGSWIIDAHTLKYMHDKYHIKASCNCKDQWGTDGYTIWGGYYNGAYYPSRFNALCPAQTKENQIDLPVFRMLGSDPVRQYDIGLSLEEGAVEWQQVATLEPVYTGDYGGGNKKWVDWYIKNNFNGKCLSYSYAQVGQENSFGWERMSKGLGYQYSLLRHLRSYGMVEVETLGESGEWFSSSFNLTPSSSICAMSDLETEKEEEKGKKSFWYNCKNYRVNVYCENGKFWIRDLFIFDENYHEKYLAEREQRDVLEYDNLPVMDGNRYSGHSVRAGIYPFAEESLVFDTLSVSENEDELELHFMGTSCGRLRFRFAPDKIVIVPEINKDKFRMSFIYDIKNTALPEISVESSVLRFKHNGKKYNLRSDSGGFERDNEVINITGNGGKIVLNIIFGG